MRHIPGPPDIIMVTIMPIITITVTITIIMAMETVRSAPPAATRTCRIRR
jgi:hypothetical protein